MAAASYTEDLTDLNAAEAVTWWVELTGTIGGETYNVNGTPAGADPDYPYIQGSFSVTQDCTKDTSVGSLASKIVTLGAKVGEVGVKTSLDVNSSCLLSSKSFCIHESIVWSDS